MKSVALSSGAPPSAIGILRISGEHCHNIADIFLKYNKSNFEYGKIFLAKFIDPKDQNIIDEPMVFFSKGPRTYTGQDTVEIYVHGGRYIIQKCLELLQAKGVRSAEPGEFTRRAYLSGKLDLSESEGIKQLIDANSEHQWLAAQQLSSGKLKDTIEQLRKELVEAMAWLEARIDFPDEKETSEVELENVEIRVTKVLQRIKSLLDTYNSGKVASQGLNVALIGKPNAGKSTLMNYLLNEDRAIVSSHAGTTRDYLKESCLINGRLINLIDTAGIRNSNCEIEKIGIERSLNIAQSADLVLLLLPSDQDHLPPDPDWLTFYNKLDEKITIPILTKSDLGIPKWWNEICHPEKTEVSIHKEQSSYNNKICQLLTRKVDTLTFPIKNDLFISSSRHKACLEKALSYLDSFYTKQQEGAFEEMLAFELRLAAQALDQIIGRIENDDILDVVFSSFCVGK